MANRERSGPKDRRSDRQCRKEHGLRPINNLAPSARGGIRLASRYWKQYFAAERPAFNTNLNRFLVEMVKDRRPAKALDVAMGQGRNSSWLVPQGWDVTGFDIARDAVQSADRQACKLGLKIHVEVNTIDAFAYGEYRWDLILASYAGAGPPADHVEHALKPGGILVVETFHDDALKSMRICGVRFKTGELLARYPGLRTVRYEEPITMPDFAPKPARVVRLCAEKAGGELIEIPTRLKLRGLGIRQVRGPRVPAQTA